MASLISSATKQASWKVFAAFLIVILGWSFCLLKAYQLRIFPRNGIDYRSVYGSSRCLLDGCNPYGGPETKIEYLMHGGALADTEPSDVPNTGPFSQYYAAYPPSALFYFIPLALLPWHVSWAVWLSLSLSLYGITALLFSWLCSQYLSFAASFCLAVFLAVQDVGVFLAQPSLLVASLCGIGMWCLLQEKAVKTGIFCFAMSLTLKPQLGALVLVYFFLASPIYRRRAWQIVSVTVLLCLPGILWIGVTQGSNHWIENYTANLKGVASRGHLSDPGPDNPAGVDQIASLQTIISVFRNDPEFYNLSALTFALLIGGLWIYPVLNLPPSKEKDLLCIAAIMTLSLLPIYHRVYDSLLFLPVFPLIAFLLNRTVILGKFAFSSYIWFSFMISRYYQRIFIRHFGVAIQKSIEACLGGKAYTALFLRPVPIALLAMTLFYLVLFYGPPRQLFLENSGKTSKEIQKAEAVT